MVSLLQLISALAVLVSLTAGISMPKFKPPAQYDDRISLMVKDKVWHVGDTNKHAILDSASLLEIRLAYENAQCRTSTIYLMYKCKPVDDFQSKPLATIGESGWDVCRGDQSVKLNIKKDGSAYKIQTDGTNAKPSSVMQESIELKVRLECSEFVKIYSQSLYVWNFDALMNNENPVSCPQSVNGKCNRHFMTQAAFDFVTKVNSQISADGEVQFVQPEIVEIVKRAPLFIRNLMSFRVDIATGGTCTSNYHSRSFGKHYQMPTTPFQGTYLDFKTGKLHYSAYPLTQDLKGLSESTSYILICSNIRYGQSFQHKVTVVSSTEKSKFPYSIEKGDANSGCRIPKGVEQRTVDIFSSNEEFILECPILCGRLPDTAGFSKDGVKMTFHGASNSPWFIRSEDGISVSKSETMIKFPHIVSQKHAATYTCHAGAVEYAYNVRVTALPIFKTGHTLPSKIYAMEGQGLSYSCTTSFSNLKSLTLSPKFKTLQMVGQMGSWVTVDAADFNKIFPNQAVATSTIDKIESKTLNLTVSAVPSVTTNRNANFTHRFLCQASISKEDADKIGMSSYDVTSQSDVVFLRRPTVDAFDRGDSNTNCSLTQQCPIIKGVNLYWALKDEMSQYLRSVGVQLRARFKLEDRNLDEIDIISNSADVQISFDKNFTVLSFIVKPESSREVRETLGNRVLFPVIDFLYPISSSLQNLQMDKGKYDASPYPRDCVNNPRCFYSTEFDRYGTLVNLHHNFLKDEKVFVAYTNPGAIIGSVVAALIILFSFLLIVYYLRRDRGVTYLLDKKERQQGNQPELEAKNEKFKEYQRAEVKPLNPPKSKVQLSSNTNNEDLELAEFGEDKEEGDISNSHNEGASLNEAEDVNH